MPDLGKYGAEIGAAYAISLLLLAGLIAYYWWRAARVKRALAAVEARRAKPAGDA